MNKKIFQLGFVHNLTVPGSAIQYLDIYGFVSNRIMFPVKEQIRIVSLSISVSIAQQSNPTNLVNGFGCSNWSIDYRLLNQNEQPYRLPNVNISNFGQKIRSDPFLDPNYGFSISNDSNNICLRHQNLMCFGLDVVAFRLDLGRVANRNAFMSVILSYEHEDEPPPPISFL